VTDCNILLGRIQPDFFPSVFGPNGDQLLNTNAVQSAFSKLSIQANKPPEDIAWGFLKVAVAEMARAIKRVSLHKGHDVRSYTLCCFGGAAGQHACLVADELGMRSVLIHPNAGVMSALGMGRAQRREIRKQTLAIPLTPGAMRTLNDALNDLEAKAKSELGEDVAVQRTVELRYEGTDTPLDVAVGTPQALAEAFHRAHRDRFGFAFTEKPMVIESAVVEVRETNAPLAPPMPPAPTTGTAPATTINMAYADGVKSCPLYLREHLPAQSQIEGPAIVVDSTATNIIEPGWTATVLEHGDLLLTRISELDRTALGTDVDPALLTVFNHRFMSVAERMGVVLEQTAHSVNIKERRDYSCALFDGQGRLVANAPHIPVHLGSMGASVRTVLELNHGKIKPGDSFALNDPYSGGTHLPDITVVTPMFNDAGTAIEFVLASRGHHADVGGITPGSMPPQSRTIDQEGIRFTNEHIVSAGVFNEAAVAALFATSRNTAQNVADLKAQVAANTSGLEALTELVAEFTLGTVQAYMKHVRENAAESVRELLSTLPGGSYRCTNDAGLTIQVRVKVNSEKRTAVIDFTGSSPQSEGNHNAPEAVCRAAVLYVLRALCGADIPLNEGCLEPVDIVIEHPSVLSPQAPAAVVAGNVETSQMIADALLAAVGAQAGSQGTMNNLTFGNHNHQYYETLCGGAGAGPTFDGASAVHTHMTNSRLTDPEILECRYPVQVVNFGIRKYSGGIGQHVGGDGVVRQIKFLEPVTVSILSDRRRSAPAGLNGGGPGKCGHNAVVRASGQRERLDGSATCELQDGDAIEIRTPGGGGYGNPAAFKKASTVVHGLVALFFVSAMLVSLWNSKPTSRLDTPGLSAERYVDRALSLDMGWDDLLRSLGKTRFKRRVSTWKDAINAYEQAILELRKRKVSEEKVTVLLARLAVVHFE